MKNIFAAAITIAVSVLSTHAQDNGQINSPPTMAAPADDHKIGVGAEFSAPIGVNAKYWLNDTFALDAAAGWSPYAHSTAEFHSDFLVHDFDLLKPSVGQMPVYFGGGILGRLRDDGRNNEAGFRFPFGVSYIFNNAPLDIFAEIAPEVIFAPFARGGIDGGVGFRVWF